MFFSSAHRLTCFVPSCVGSARRTTSSQCPSSTTGPRSSRTSSLISSTHSSPRWTGAHQARNDTGEVKIFTGLLPFAPLQCTYAVTGKGSNSAQRLRWGCAMSAGYWGVSGIGLVVHAHVCKYIFWCLIEENIWPNTRCDGSKCTKQIVKGDTTNI